VTLTTKNERIYTVLLAPHVSEKSTRIGEASNQYAFKVARNASKRDIRDAVEGLFNVKVENVTTLNVRGKEKRTQRGISRKNHWKKAYVRLAEGQTLDVTTGAP
jgi:large subunit ribosomal protein L23